MPQCAICGAQATWTVSTPYGAVTATTNVCDAHLLSVLDHRAPSNSVASTYPGGDPLTPPAPQLPA